MRRKTAVLYAALYDLTEKQQCPFSGDEEILYPGSAEVNCIEKKAVFFLPQRGLFSNKRKPVFQFVQLY
jgi:hypothetical protein